MFKVIDVLITTNWSLVHTHSHTQTNTYTHMQQNTSEYLVNISKYCVFIKSKIKKEIMIGSTNKELAGQAWGQQWP